MFIGIILETGPLSLVLFLVLSLSFIHLSIKLSSLHIEVVQWPSGVQLFVTPWIIACQASLSLTISQSLPKFTSIASVMQSPKWCPTLRDPMDYSMPGFPVTHHLSEFAQVHIHCISDAIQPSHPLLHSSLSAFNLSQQQHLLQ